MPLPNARHKDISRAVAAARVLFQFLLIPLTSL